MNFNKSIGAVIKEEREKRNLSFADLSKLTKIPVKYLVLLEKNKFDFFPSAVVKGFLKVISWQLKIIDKYIFDEFDKLFGKKKIQERNLNYVKGQRFNFRINYVSYIFFLIIFLALSSKITHYLYSFKPESVSQVNLSSESKLIIKDASLRLVLDLKEKSWARIIVDGKRVFEGILNSGSNPIWTAQDKIKIRIGNAAVVYAYLNDKPLGVLGEKGEIIEKVFEKI
jgi:transcriptional regulator with XRE-family HTH domain